jgi:hypothetical protein
MYKKEKQHKKIIELICEKQKQEHLNKQVTTNKQQVVSLFVL